MPRTSLEELSDLLPNALRRDRLRIEARLHDLLARSGPQGVGASLDRLLVEARRSIELRHRRHEGLPQISFPQELPITSRKDDIIAAIKSHQVVVIAGETGSGKTTQIPKMCLEAGYGIEGKIGCTQPRRVAALSISRRIAEELNTTWGREVGCKIRFTDHSSPETYIKLMTDGILLAETQGDRSLLEYEVIVIDEAHERSLNIDFLLGHLKQLLPQRPDLKLIITSATIETEAFSAAFGNAPIIEVSGRMFPIEVRYEDFDHLAEERGDWSYIDSAVAAVDHIQAESHEGDILIFMPSERDIRETEDDLVGRWRASAEIIPLYGRLSSEEQERAFKQSNRRKIIIATNIAETSLTIPGIRYVVDTGLVRMSRYSPRTRTRRLPIEEISQSSANQRAGRCGRVSNGVCIRLFAEEDFDKRPKYTQPEIQRANLAEVILRMKAWQLGEIESFPFLNPPHPQAISAGYDLLHELGAIDGDQKITQMGRELARLPIDPSMGRMAIQSVREGALEQTLIIAAGLSIQDPRERPLDKQEAADFAHRQFVDPDSDFLALLNIWNAYHDQWEQFRTQNQMRKFCRANFLSYIRMREWADIHAQLKSSLAETIDLRPLEKTRATPPDAIETQRDKERKPSVANYAGIHRSILSGLLGHIALREERNIYKAARDREVVIFPGSSLFSRDDKKKSAKSLKDLDAPAQADASSGQPEWIVAGEIVETTRLYARTVAGLNPQWIIDLGSHVCSRAYTEPKWVASAGRVVARERITIFGLTVQDKNIDFGKVDPARATRLFIRALVLGEVETPHKFVEQNNRLRDKIELWRTRNRNHTVRDPNEALFDFYKARLENISSTHDLNRVMRQRLGADPRFLMAEEAELTGGQQLGWDEASFPHEATIAGHKAELDYAYAPGEEHDGVTVKMPVTSAHNLKPHMLDWLVPGLKEEQIEFLLKELPKSQRVPLMPLPPKIRELAARLKPGDDLETLRALVNQLYGASLPLGAWTREMLPNHLRPRLALVGSNGKVVALDRDVSKLTQGLEKRESAKEQNAWGAAAEKFDRFDLTAWNFGDFPERLEVGNVGGVPLHGFPGLQVEEGHVNLRLFRKREEAEAGARHGMVRLAELALQKELAWLHKDLRALDKLKPLYITLGAGDELTETAFSNLKARLLKLGSGVLPLKQSAFEKLVEKAEEEMPNVLAPFLASLTNILQMRQEILVHKKPYPSMRAELDQLLPKAFLSSIPYERLPHIPRYLKAMLIRAERAALNPGKDAERARSVAPYLASLAKLRAIPSSAPRLAALNELRWMIEEFKVSLFAQELGTPHPISAKRLDAQIEKITSL